MNISPPTNRTLVTGAAGKTGRAVVAALARRGVEVRAWVRREGDRIPGAGEHISGDMLDASLWSRAVRDVGALYLICPNMSDGELQIATLAVRSARQVAVEHLIYHSVLHPQVEAMPHHWQKMRVEELIIASGLAYTILQPTAYMQNISSQLASVQESGRYSVPYAVTAPISLVDLLDVAEVAAVVAATPAHFGATYEVSGTYPLTQNDVAAILGEVFGRRVSAVEIPLDSWRSEAEASGLRGYALDSLIQMFRYYAHHGLPGNPNVLRWLLQREPTSLHSWARGARQELDRKDVGDYS